jgi:DNA-binding HxlR family transcriptional regulator
METLPTAPRPAALAWSAGNCTLGRAMAVLGERWTVVVLREVFNGLRRFDDLRARTAIPRQVLSDRLRTLVDEGILHRHPYREPGERVRHEYRLTGKGFELYPVLLAVRDWGDRWLADPGGPPMVAEHRGCGGTVRTELRCDAGHPVTDPRDVLARPGPGARPRHAAGG